MTSDLSGDSALVVASSSGLGKAAAASLAERGANVVVNGRDPDRLDAAVEELRETAEGSVVGYQGDLTDPDDTAAMVQKTAVSMNWLTMVLALLRSQRWRPPVSRRQKWKKRMSRYCAAR